MKPEAFVADWKRKEVSDIQNFIEGSDVVGLVDVSGIGAKQMLAMRASLRDLGVKLRMSRNRLLKLALADASKNKKGVEQVSDIFGASQFALLASSENPFKIFQMLLESQTQAPAKGGETAPYDIIIEKGPTAFPAGPIVGDFQTAGFPAAIEKGKIVIRKKHTAVAEGDIISAEVASALTKLEVYPITVGMQLIGAFDGETFYLSDVLNIDMDEFRGNVQSATAQAFNLAFNTRYFTGSVMPSLLSKAHTDALGVAISTAYPSESTIKALLAKAHGSMLGVAGKSGDGVDDELKEMLGNAASTAATQAPVEETAESSKDEEDEEEEEASDEDVGSGLGALFG
ncbi:MAG: 50S ribosomal protein L10 [Candidatus Poseidoniales archaeon]|jgi:large subunit ribosomal protein L10